MSSRLKLDASGLLKALIEREKESNTIIGPGIAIPHIVKVRHYISYLI